MAYLYQTPITMPRGTHYGSDYWITYSFKLKRIVHSYSMLEYANFISLEMNPNVEYFCEQPLKIEGIDITGKRRMSVFDFWVQYKNHDCEFQEVKYISELNGQTDAALRSQRQIEFQKNWCAENNQKLRVITDNDLYTGPFILQNLELLHKYLLRYPQCQSINEKESLYALLKKENLTIGDIFENHLLPENYGMAILAQELISGNICMNLANKPLDKYTEVQYAK